MIALIANQIFFGSGNPPNTPLVYKFSEIIVSNSCIMGPCDTTDMCHAG